MLIFKFANPKLQLGFVLVLLDGGNGQRRLFAAEVVDFGRRADAILRRACRLDGPGSGTNWSNLKACHLRNDAMRLGRGISWKGFVRKFEDVFSSFFFIEKLHFDRTRGTLYI